MRKHTATPKLVPLSHLARHDSPTERANVGERMASLKKGGAGGSTVSDGPRGLSLPAVTMARATERANVGERMANLKHGANRHDLEKPMGHSKPAITMARAAEQPMRQANRRPTDQCELTSEQRQHLFMQGLARQVGDACAAWLEGRGITCRPLLENPAGANVKAGMSTREPDPPRPPPKSPGNHLTSSKAKSFHVQRSKSKSPQPENLTTP